MPRPAPHPSTAPPSDAGNDPSAATPGQATGPRRPWRATLGALGLAWPLLGLAACNEAGAGPEGGVRTLVDVAVEAGTYDLFLGAMGTMGLLPALNAGGPFTLLAVPDEAFALLPPSALDRILNNPGILGPIVSYHIVPGVRTAAQAGATTSLPTLYGLPLPTRVIDGVTQVGDARIVLPDQEAWNGILHGVDRLLLPEVVLDVVETLQYDRDFHVLVDLLAVAGLRDEVRFDGDFTVFAPTDAAFGALSETARAEVLQDPQLARRILEYHVVPGRFVVADLVPRDSLTTLEGSALTLAPAGSRVTVDGIPLLRFDLRTTNGVVHVVDELLLPPGVTLGMAPPQP
jgi:transforming growth factor-beta-induced protein